MFAGQVRAGEAYARKSAFKRGTAFPQLLRVTVETVDPMTTSQVVAPRFPAPLGVVRTRSPACETLSMDENSDPSLSG